MKKVILMFGAVVLLVTLIAAAAAQEIQKFYFSKIGATVVVSGTEEFVAVVDRVVKESNSCNRIIDAELAESNSPSLIKYLAIMQAYDRILIHTSSGEFLSLPNGDHLKVIAMAFISQEIQQKYNAKRK